MVEEVEDEEDVVVPLHREMAQEAEQGENSLKKPGKK